MSNRRFYVIVQLDKYIHGRRDVMTGIIENFYPYSRPN